MQAEPEYKDLIERFAQLEAEFKAAIAMLETEAGVAPSAEEDELSKHFAKELEDWSVNVYGYVLSQEALQKDRETQAESAVDDLDVEEEIMLSSEELYEQGWDLDDPLLKKHIRNQFVSGRTEEQMRDGGEYIPRFSSEQWRKGWLLLRHLDSHVSGGTKAEQLKWLRSALLYNRWLPIFKTKEAYAKSVQYELKLRNEAR